MISIVNLVSIHECLCDRTRLRIMNLLLDGPLCVCHLQEVLREPQVKVSRHLAYLRERGLLAAERCGQWMIYSLPQNPPSALAAQLACLQDASAEEPVFRQDKQRLAKLRKNLTPDSPSCVRQSGPRRGRRTSAPL
jgi:ArsR family transcriptional regulator